MALNRNIYQKNKSQQEKNDGEKGDFDDIVKNTPPEDIETHKVLGLTYRVHIHSTSSNDKDLKETGDYIESTDKGESSEALAKEAKQLEASKKKMLKQVHAVINQLLKTKGEVKADKIPMLMRSTWEEVIDDARDKLLKVQADINKYKKLEKMEATAHIVSDVIDNAKVVVRTYKSFT